MKPYVEYAQASITNQYSRLMHNTKCIHLDENANYSMCQPTSCRLLLHVMKDVEVR